MPVNMANATYLKSNLQNAAAGSHPQTRMTGTARTTVTLTRKRKHPTVKTHTVMFSGHMTSV